MVKIVDPSTLNSSMDLFPRRTTQKLAKEIRNVSKEGVIFYTEYKMSQALLFDVLVATESERTFNSLNMRISLFDINRPVQTFQLLEGPK